MEKFRQSRALSVLKERLAVYLDLPKSRLFIWNEHKTIQRKPNYFDLLPTLVEIL